jgi:sporulation protein YlmC with PRC-barrel domain
MPARKQHGPGQSTSVGVPDNKLLGATNLVGNRLYDTKGNVLGKLEEIVLDVRTGCVRHVVIAVGGFMGFGRRRLAVPWSALTPDPDYCRAVLDIAQMRLMAVRIPDGDLWLRGPAARGVGSGLGAGAFPRPHRALGTGD